MYAVMGCRVVATRAKSRHIANCLHGHVEYRRTTGLAHRKLKRHFRQGHCIALALGGQSRGIVGE